MKVTTLESNALPFHFAWKGTLRPYNSVHAYNSVDCQKHLTLMSWERNSKTTKVAESRLVLGTEFLSIAFSFDLFLVLTVEVFCVALYSIIVSSWIHSLYIHGTLLEKIKLLIARWKKFQICNG